MWHLKASRHISTIMHFCIYVYILRIWKYVGAEISAEGWRFDSGFGTIGSELCMFSSFLLQPKNMCEAKWKSYIVPRCVSKWVWMVVFVCNPTMKWWLVQGVTLPSPSGCWERLHWTLSCSGRSGYWRLVVGWMMGRWMDGSMDEGKMDIWYEKMDDFGWTDEWMIADGLMKGKYLEGW